MIRFCQIGSYPIKKWLEEMGSPQFIPLGYDLLSSHWHNRH